MAIIGQIFACDRGRFTLTPPLGVIPCECCHKWYRPITKNKILWATFLLQKVSAYLQPLLCSGPPKATEFGETMQNNGHYSV